MRMHKADKSDVHRLAQTHFNTERRVKKGQDAYFDQMRALSRYYHELDEELAMLRSRMHTLLQLTFPEMESLFTQKSDKHCTNAIRFYLFSFVFPVIYSLT